MSRAAKNHYNSIKFYLNLIGDGTYTDWEDLGEEKQQEYIKSLRYVAFSKSSVTPEDLHLNWLSFVNSENISESVSRELLVEFKELSLNNKIKAAIICESLKHHVKEYLGEFTD